MCRWMGSHFHNWTDDVLFFKFYYMCIPHNITTFVLKKKTEYNTLQEKKKIKKYYSTVCTYELETVGVLIQ